jgi:hypothetical protein
MQHNQHRAHWPFSAETRVRAHFSPRETRWTVALCQLSLAELQFFFPASIIPTKAPHLSYYVVPTRTNGRGLRTFQTKHCSWRHRHTPTPVRLLYKRMSVTKLAPEATNAAGLKQGNSGHKCYTPGLPLPETPPAITGVAVSICSSS